MERWLILFAIGGLVIVAWSAVELSKAGSVS
jgi:hypothetical protein